MLLLGGTFQDGRNGSTVAMGSEPLAQHLQAEVFLGPSPPPLASTPELR